QRVALLQCPDHLTEPDGRWRPREAKAPTSAPVGGNVPGSSQIAHHLGEVVTRNPELAGDLVGGEDSRRIARQAHEGAQSEVGESGQPHGNTRYLLRSLSSHDKQVLQIPIGIFMTA